MCPPLNGKPVKHLATDDTGYRSAHGAVTTIPTHNKIPILSVNPVSQTRRVDSLASGFKNESLEQISLSAPVTCVERWLAAMRYTRNHWIHD